jgi:hypothetical protein
MTVLPFSDIRKGRVRVLHFVPRYPQCGEQVVEVKSKLRRPDVNLCHHLSPPATLTTPTCRTWKLEDCGLVLRIQFNRQPSNQPPCGRLTLREQLKLCHHDITKAARHTLSLHPTLHHQNQQHPLQHDVVARRPSEQAPEDHAGAHGDVGSRRAGHSSNHQCSGARADF